jgi:hypothetical protein
MVATSEFDRNLQDLKILFPNQSDPVSAPNLTFADCGFAGRSRTKSWGDAAKVRLPSGIARN